MGNKSLLHVSIDNAVLSAWQSKIERGQYSKWIEDRLRFEVEGKVEEKNLTPKQKILSQEKIIQEMKTQIVLLKKQLIESQQKIRELNEQLESGKEKYEKIKQRRF